MWVSSITADAETTGITSTGSFVDGGAAASRLKGRIWSMVRPCDARTRSNPSRDKARLRLRKFEMWAWAEGLGLRLSETIAADTLLPETALSGPGAALANLPQLQVTSITGSALQIDAGVAPPAGGGFEVRRRDWDFGPAIGQDLVLRSPVRSFSIPREAQVEQYYVRMFDASTPPVY